MVLIFSIEEWIWDFSADKDTVTPAPDPKVPFFVGLPVVQQR